MFSDFVSRGSLKGRRQGWVAAGLAARTTARGACGAGRLSGRQGWTTTLTPWGLAPERARSTGAVAGAGLVATHWP